MVREVIVLLLLLVASYIFVGSLRKFADALKINSVRKRVLANAKSFFLHVTVAVALWSAYYLTF